MPRPERPARAPRARRGRASPSPSAQPLVDATARLQYRHSCAGGGVAAPRSPAANAASSPATPAGGGRRGGRSSSSGVPPSTRRRHGPRARSRSTTSPPARRTSKCRCTIWAFPRRPHHPDRLALLHPRARRPDEGAAEMRVAGHVRAAGVGVDDVDVEPVPVPGVDGGGEPRVGGPDLGVGAQRARDVDARVATGRGAAAPHQALDHARDRHDHREACRLPERPA